MTFVEWMLKNMSAEFDPEPVFEGLVRSIESPPGRSGRRREAEPSEDVKRARALELRIAKWLAKQVRN